ncbi:MAG TPA: cytochrome c maturation protein CcmE [Patescibacteria group bacterium]|nr:cytochrome c maturation protein CcmE [Patescibacteria group bacterium]
MGRRARFRFILLVLLCLAGAAALALYAMRDNISYFFTPQQVADMKAKNDRRVREGATFRLGGLVKPGSLVRRTDNLVIEFIVTDELRDQKVSYEGIPPDLFREGQGVVATGSLRGDVFHAKQLLAKHDENYTPPELAREMKRVHDEKTGGAR